jgi:predicted  nucleic acid-binding Zn-ribbon protein
VSRQPNGRFVLRPPNEEKQMFGKKDLVEDLIRDLDRARDKRNALASERDALASGIATLTAQVAQLEARLSEEKDRRERERAVGEIEGIKKRLEETATALAPVMAVLCEATETAAAVVLEARELNSFLKETAAEVDAAIDLVLRELHRRAEAMRAGLTPPHLPQLEVLEPPKDDLPLLFPSRNNEVGKIEFAEHQGSTAA